MLFNSLEFSIFLPVVFILYWLVTNRNIQVQNTLLLVASYVFYGWWDWRFLSLILFSSSVDFFVGIGLSKTKELKKKKTLLWLSIFVNLGLLGVFKYHHFFIESFIDLFKKMVIADNCAFIVNQIFSDYSQYSGSTLVLGAILFAFQIYGDFSGYSDIAIGTARLFGFDLKTNFSYPYFSRDIAEFWRRWHISLSTWFRDYLYIPIGGSKGSKSQTVRNIFIIFLVSGFWHGANWTFIFWGLFHAVCFLPLLVRKNNRIHLDLVAKNRWLPNVKEILGMLITFTLVTIGWIIFRAETLTQAVDYLSIICSSSLLEKPYAFGIGVEKIAITGFSVISMIVIEWVGRNKDCPILITTKKRTFLQWLICYLFILVIFLFSAPQQEFIYFQF